MIKTEIQEAFNRQLNAELYSAYLYLSMSSHLESAGLPGMGQWMRAQAQEEVIHAMKFYQFIIDRGGKVVLTQIDTPPAEWSSPLAVFQDAYQHECKVTELINGLVDLASTHKAHAEHSFLQWFVNEQVEEEATAQGIVDKLGMIGDHAAMLLAVDSELGQRPLPAPPATAAAD